MDRLSHSRRNLVALCGLAGLLVSTGCRDRNVQVPPPAHYTDGEVTYPEGGEYPGGSQYPGYAPGPGESSAVDPYAGSGPAAPGTYDPSASPTSAGYDSLGYPTGSGAGASVYDGSAGFGVPPVEGTEGGGASTGYAGPYASPSSTSSFATDPYATGEVADPYADLNASSGAPGVFASETAGAGTAATADPIGDASAAVFPGFDSAEGVPPIPDSLPDLP